MAKYIPSPNGIKYCYYQTANAEKTVIKSGWKVELSANETIEIQDAIDTGTHIYYLELYVKSAGGPAYDHTWEGVSDVTICPDKEYDTIEVSELADKQNIVRGKILNLLSFYDSSEYRVIANVTRESETSGNKSTDTVSGSGTIDIS